MQLRQTNENVCLSCISGLSLEELRFPTTAAREILFSMRYTTTQGAIKYKEVEQDDVFTVVVFLRIEPMIRLPYYNIDIQNELYRIS